MTTDLRAGPAQVLNGRHDIDLESLLEVAWRGRPLALGAEALATLAARRQSFLGLLARDPQPRIYGITVGQGEMAHREMDQAEIEALARMKPLAAAAAFGEPYPPRVVRGMLLARLANWLEGHAMASPRLAEALIQLLNDGPLPRVAQGGQGGPGEILALYPLFAALSQRFDLAIGERGALINGAPCAGALLGDAVLAAQRRLALAESVLALAIAAFEAPREHYDLQLAALWGGAHNATAFGALQAQLGPPQTGRPAREVQAPVSYRIVPALLGQAYWALGQAEAGARCALSAVTHNPVYLPPDQDHPEGRCLSTGGYHNSLGAPLLDGLAATWADLCLLCLRLSVGLLNGRVSGYPDFLLTERAQASSDGHGAVGYLPMVIVGYLEEARAAAQRTFIAAGDASVFGQDDVAAPVFAAWPKEARAGRCLDAALAALAVTASQAFHATDRRPPPGPLLELLDELRTRVPPVGDDRVLGGELQALGDHFTTRAFDPDSPLATMKDQRP